MSTVPDLQLAVQTTIASKRLGTPVFVRYLMQGQDPPNVAVERLTLATLVIQGWLGQFLSRVYATGSIAAGQAALTLEFKNAGSAVVTWSRGQPRGDGIDLMVL